MDAQKMLLQLALLLIFKCLTTLCCHGQILATGITAEEKQQILYEHNRLRQLVATGRYPGQPGAANMREIVWDNELAIRAQQWAENCEFRHDPHRTINRFTMGQNLAIIWSTGPLEPQDGDFPSRIQSWFNEVQKYSFGDAWSPKTGHYSQLVWGETNLVGCGYSEYKDSYKYNKLWVCNYGPGGNVVGYNPYEVGRPNCGTYGMNPSPRYQGLCAAPTSSAVGLSTNTIETYEYTQNYNNQPTNYYYDTTSKYPQQTTTSNYPSSSLPQQATILSTQQQGQYIPTVSAKNGYSYNTKSNNARTTYSFQTLQYHRKNKLEAYKPTASEFQKAIQKHTILRTSTSSSQESEQQQQQQQQEQVDNTDTQVDYYGYQEPESTTASTAKRGWSLLTWRG